MIWKWYECHFSASSQLAASHVTRNGKIDRYPRYAFPVLAAYIRPNVYPRKSPPPKMTQGVMTPLTPLIAFQQHP
jgi:hypothetical protein